MKSLKPSYDELEKRVAELKQSEDELKRSLAVLRQSENRFRDLIEGSIQGILIHRDHKPLFVNETWAIIHGYTQKEILAMDAVTHLIAPDDRQRMIGYRQARLRGEYAPIVYEYKGLHRDGSSIWLDNRVKVVQWDGQQAIQTTVFDITGRKKAEEEREKLIVRLQEALHEINSLSGLLPICIHCKNIRDDSGYWNKLETYIQDHSTAQFSHSICEQCLEKYYPDQDDD